MSNFVKVPHRGGFGHDYNDFVVNPGKYSIPIPNYRYDDEYDETKEYDPEDNYEYINVEVTRIIKPYAEEGSSLNAILGYDENGEPQAWYYNGAHRCYKRVFQDGTMGDRSDASLLYFFEEDCEIDDPEIVSELVNYMKSL